MVHKFVYILCGLTIGLTIVIVIGFLFSTPFTNFKHEITKNMGYNTIPEELGYTQDTIDMNQNAQAADNEEPKLTESSLHDLVNLERSSRGLNELQYSKELEALAYEHSLALDNYDASGHSDLQRYKVLDICKANTGENIFQGWSHDGFAPLVPIRDWMNSSFGHRENLLYPNWSYEGIGLVEDRASTIITQVFC